VFPYNIFAYCSICRVDCKFARKKKDLRRCFLCNKFKRGGVSNKWWTADHGLLVTDALASLVGTLALITQRISFLKGGRAAATVNVSEFRRDILWGCV
jgi:hypothetical protein